MEVIVINLHNRSERFSNALSNLRKCDLSDYVIRKEACTINRAKTEFHSYISEDAFKNIFNLSSTNIIPSWGAVACAISHLECYKYIIDKNLDYCIICEDDFEVNNSNRFRFALNKTINRIRVNKNVENYTLITFNSKQRSKIYFNCNPHYGNYDIGFNNDIIQENTTPSIEYLERPFTGSHFYIINLNMAKLLYENLAPLTYQIDIETGLLLNKIIRNNNKINNQYLNNICFWNFKNCGIKQSSKFTSDIQYYFLKRDNISFLKLDENLLDYILSFCIQSKDIKGDYVKVDDSKYLLFGYNGYQW